MILSELGNIINIITAKRKPTVKVLWNAIPELNHDQETAIQVLQESNQKKDIEDAWRMDVDTIDDYNDDESNM